jgi:hypothetical protein
VAPRPKTPSARASRVWRMVLIVVSFQLVLIASGMVVFTALGFGSEASGGCGGG